MSAQADLFGEPARRPEASQWFTPPWLARRLTSWVPRTASVLEPSCGGGALIEALLRAGHPPELIVGVELSQGNFLGERLGAMLPNFDVVVMNPPFEDNGHLRFVLRALELAPVVVGVFPVSFEFSGLRDRELWATRGVVTRRARLPERVDYGGDQSPSFDSVALQIERRECPRERGEIHLVNEEVWTNG